MLKISARSVVGASENPTLCWPLYNKLLFLLPVLRMGQGSDSMGKSSAAVLQSDEEDTVDADNSASVLTASSFASQNVSDVIPR